MGFGQIVQPPRDLGAVPVFAEVRPERAELSVVGDVEQVDGLLDDDALACNLGRGAMTNTEAWSHTRLAPAVSMCAFVRRTALFSSMSSMLLEHAQCRHSSVGTSREANWILSSKLVGTWYDGRADAAWWVPV